MTEPEQCTDKDCMMVRCGIPHSTHNTHKGVVDLLRTRREGQEVGVEYGNQEYGDKKHRPGEIRPPRALFLRAVSLAEQRRKARQRLVKIVVFTVLILGMETLCGWIIWLKVIK